MHFSSLIVTHIGCYAFVRTIMHHVNGFLTHLSAACVEDLAFGWQAHPLSRHARYAHCAIYETANLL